MNQQENNIIEILKQTMEGATKLMNVASSQIENLKSQVKTEEDAKNFKKELESSGILNKFAELKKQFEQL